MTPSINASRIPAWVTPTSAATRYLAAIAGTLATLALAMPAAAGLSSENVVVVVNGSSPLSRTIANHYVELRQIPTNNIVVLEDVPSDLKVGLDVFRDKILKPLLEQIDARGISSTARVIAYSADFPTAVGVAEHTKKLTEPTAKKYQLPTASITGLTYFYRYVLADNPSYLSFGANLYARGRFSRHFVNPFGGEQKERFEEAKKLQDEAKFAEAAAIWQEIHDRHSSIPGIAIQGAKCYSESDQPENAVKMIMAAIKSGWWSLSYLQDTPSLNKHLEHESLAKLIPFLDNSPTAWQGPMPFSSRVGWTGTGSQASIKDGGVPYLCACSLAVVRPNASTLSSAVRNLRRSSKADRQFPQGRFAFGAGSDVRAKTRFPGIADAVVYLQENDFDTEIYRGSLPTKEGAILGIMAGTSNANVMSGKWVMVRGAIADNLTSYGGVFEHARQTKLTDFLSAGAAMSSGSVAEPYSLQYKFPLPMLYAFYARGLSAIESFYQSVSSPYQLLIVGDPLTQPFAKAPDDIVEVSLLTDGKRRLRLSRRSLELRLPKSQTATIEVSVNDRMFQTTPAVPNIDINWPDQSSGVFDIRATLTGLDRCEPRVTFMTQIDVQGDRPAPTATITKSREDIDGFGNDGTNATAIQVKLNCEGAERIELVHWGKVVATVKSASGNVTVPTNSLGGGPLRFRPVAYFGDTAVRGKTIVDQPELSK